VKAQEKELSMQGLNKVFLLGYVGQAPEASESIKGRKYTRLRLATNRSTFDAETSSRKEETVWHTVFVFGRSGENCEKYLRKGQAVFVEGHLSNYSVEENGEKRWRSSITAERVDFLSMGPKTPQTPHPQS
jgi:single-strand DNA-binding protein